MSGFGQERYVGMRYDLRKLGCFCMLRFTNFLYVVSAILLSSPAFSYAETDSTYMADFGCNDGKYGLRLPKKLPDVLKLAKGKKLEAGDVEVWSNGYTTRRNYLRFRGFTLTYISYSNDRNRYMVVAAEITDSAWQRLSPFRIGASIEATRQQLKPFSENDELLKYGFGSEAGEVKFETRGGVISKVIYSCYTG